MLPNEIQSVLEDVFKIQFSILGAVQKELYTSNRVVIERMGNYLYLETVRPLPSIHYRVPHPESESQLRNSLDSFKEDLSAIGQLILQLAGK